MSEKGEQTSWLPRSNKEPWKSEHRHRMEELLRGYADKGRSIYDCAHLLGRKVRTLKKYCRRAAIKFTDYIPRNMK